ncbi:hypothetical protein ACFU93_11730 [Streptomyces sp. NPDC057611]|uniref:hypothetical protein n=1 Tax=Streptomyces sp. NPDC057611 TaxID=3346182 RepID=UPI00369CF630
MDKGAAGTPEPCDWCGRPGQVIEHSYWEEDGRLAYRDPALCSVCELLHDADVGDIADAYYEQVPDFDARLTRFEAGLADRWREKVCQGQRPPQAADERPPGFGYSWSTEAEAEL